MSLAVTGDFGIDTSSEQRPILYIFMTIVNVIWKIQQFNKGFLKTHQKFYHTLLDYEWS